MAEINPYTVLGGWASMSDYQLKQCYKRAAQAAHPDKGGTAEAMQQVQEAYALVATRSARRKYRAGLALGGSVEPCSTCRGNGCVVRRTSLRKPAAAGVQCAGCRGTGVIKI